MQMTKEIVLKDIEGIKTHFEKINIVPMMFMTGDYFPKYGSIYPFTNEKLKYLFKYIDLSKRLFTVTASGDQALFSILNGAKKIDCFDINRLAKYFMELKITAIKSLDYKEFIKFYKLRNLGSKSIRNNRNFLENINMKYFDKILTNMSYEYSLFFEAFYNFIKAMNINKDMFINFNFVPSYCGYLQKDKYYELKDKIEDIEEINYYDCDIFDLKKYVDDKKYSAMLFSNITSYFDEEQLNKLLNLLFQLEINLEQDALIQFGYGSAEPGFQQIGKNRVNKEFVDLHGDVLFDVEQEDRVITFYKSRKRS